MEAQEDRSRPGGGGSTVTATCSKSIASHLACQHLRLRYCRKCILIRRREHAELKAILERLAS